MRNRRLQLALLAYMLILISVGCTLRTVSAPAKSSPAPPPTTIATDATPRHLIDFETIVVDGITLEYAVTVPETYDPAKTYPILLALPPGGQDKDVTGKVMERLWAAEARKRSWIVLSPVAPGGKLFFEGSESLIPDFLQQVSNRYRPEGGRYHLAGISNGGISAFRIIGQHPELFRSLTVLPGFPYSKDDEAALSNLKDISITMYAGAQDSSWVDAERAAAAKLQQIGAHVTVNIVPNEGHVISSLTGAMLFDVLDGYP